MEFIKVPGFSKHVSDYVNDDEYRRLQAELADNPGAGDIMPAQAVFARCAGQMYDAAKVGEVGCELCTTTLGPIIRYG
jgi:hypothetical protein